MTAPVLERFLRYVRVNTQADARAETFPSSPGQRVLLAHLRDELLALGLTDATMDAHGYVMATIPSTSSRTDIPTIGFIAHVDTSPEMSGEDVRPLVHRAWDGRDIALPDAPDAVLRRHEHPALEEQLGHDIVTASGTTLLGADNKAGVAEIVTAAAYLMAHPEIEHGPIRVAFTPDEEIGRGTQHFDVAAFGALCAYTMDGGRRGEVEVESFSADAMTLTFYGFNTHPGYAAGRMVNALKVAAAFIDSLPSRGLSPETTRDREGFVHPYTLTASVEQATVQFILRDFTTEHLATQAAQLRQLADAAVARFPGARVEARVTEQYRNMREVLDQHPAIAAHAVEAVRRAGLPVRQHAIRGGTDGSRLSFMGLPTPNIFAGEHNFHSRLEWVSVQDMEKAVEVIVHLARIWAEPSAATGCYPSRTVSHV